MGPQPGDGAAVPEPVVRDVDAARRWRWRVVRGWALAVSAVAAAGAGLTALGSQLPATPWQVTGAAAGVVAAAGGLYLWQRWRLPPRRPRVLRWRDTVDTPYGRRSGWQLLRPALASKHDRLMLAGVTFAASATTLGAGATELASLPPGSSAVALASGAVLARRAARIASCPSAPALTPEGLVTAYGLIGWDRIGEVTPRLRATPRVRIAVAGRRRRLTLDAGDVAMPALELARLVERCRDDPQQCRALGQPPPPEGGHPEGGHPDVAAHLRR